MVKRNSFLIIVTFFAPWLLPGANAKNLGAARSLDIGWAYFNNGRYDDAAKVADSFFNQPDQTDRNKARARFLQGYVANKLRQYEIARGYLHEAKEGFSRLKKDDPAYGYAILSSVAIAKTFMDQQDLVRAEEVLKGTPDPGCDKKEHDKACYSQLGYKRFVEGRLAYLKSDYQKAIALAQQSLDACRKGGDLNGELNALSDLGIAQLIRAHQEGQPLDEGLANSQQAAKMAMDQKQSNKIYFTMINLVFYEKVSGIKSNKEALINQYIARTGDKELQFLLDQVIELARKKKKPSS